MAAGENPQRGWEPLLTGAEAAAARNVAADLAVLVPRSAGTADTTLADGLASATVTLAYLEDSGVLETDGSWREPWTVLRRSAERPRFPDSLFYGPAGTLWVRAHLSNGQVNTPGFVAILSALTRLARRGGAGGGFDLITGMVGLGVLALELLPSEGGRELLDAVVWQLDERAQATPAGVFWPARRPEPERQLDLGVAHGVPGVIGLLAGAALQGFRTAESDRLLRQSVETLCAHIIDTRWGPALPARGVPGLMNSPSRPAWCYGSPGAALTLLHAAEALDDRELARTAIELGRAVADSALDRRPADACLCHGTAGLGLAFHRLYQETGEERFRQAAADWYRETLDPSGRSGDDAQTTPARSQGIFDGACGIALALAAATSEQAPGWDRMLLMSVRAGLGRSAIANPGVATALADRLNMNPRRRRDVKGG